MLNAQGQEILKEEDGKHYDWYKEAENMTLEKFGDFIVKLTTKYQHDYGTICHAMAAAAVGITRAMDKTSQGNITGFQANAVMWQFIRRYGLIPAQMPCVLVTYDKLLYPGEMKQPLEIFPEVTEWLKTQALALLQKHKDDEAVPKEVKDHWQLLSLGFVPDPWHKKDYGNKEIAN